MNLFCISLKLKLKDLDNDSVLDYSLNDVEEILNEEKEGKAEVPVFDDKSDDGAMALEEILDDNGEEQINEDALLGFVKLLSSLNLKSNHSL